MAWLDTWFGASGEYALQILRIIGIDILLAGDNAVVIALACRTLPPRQRMAGIILGAGAAVTLRVIFTLVVQEVLMISFLKLAGALLLFWIAVKLLIAEEPTDNNVKGGANLWEAVRIVALADMVMSLDNVLAIAAAAEGDAYLIILGLLVSIPLVVVGATLITNLLSRFPFLVWVGAAMLGWVAGELIATEPELRDAFDGVAGFLGSTPQTVTTMLRTIGAILVCAVGYSIKRSASTESA